MKKIYLIRYTSKQRWEKSKGWCLIVAEKRNEAIIEFKKQVKNRIITSIQIVKSDKSKIVFNKDVSLL